MNIVYIQYIPGILYLYIKLIDINLINSSKLELLILQKTSIAMSTTM